MYKRICIIISHNRNGVGKPEGIVVHDTANDNSTIEGEINYMRNNYTNAFVHAFVDGNR
jgi:bifunctional autolysin